MILKGNGLATAQLENLATSRGKDISRGKDNRFIWVTSMLILKYRVEQQAEESQWIKDTSPGLPEWET